MSSINPKILSPFGHFFHLDCLFYVRQLCLAKFRCPSCRSRFTESPEHSEPSSQEDGHVFLPSFLPSEFMLACSNCETEVEHEYNCDACDKVICRDCLIKSPVPGGGRLDFCPKCVRFFGRLKKVKKEQFREVVPGSQFLSCSLCQSTTCHNCEVKNDDEFFCVKCVDTIATIYSEQIEGVKLSLARKPSREPAPAGKRQLVGFL